MNPDSDGQWRPAGIAGRDDLTAGDVPHRGILGTRTASRLRRAAQRSRQRAAAAVQAATGQHAIAAPAAQAATGHRATAGLHAAPIADEQTTGPGAPQPLMHDRIPREKVSGKPPWEPASRPPGLDG
jgi:hypothetical protein